MAVLLIGTAAITGLYWILWFADRRWLASDTRAAYYQFENAFPLADGWWAATLVVGAVALVRRRPLALGALLVSCGAGLYLFCMDVLYDLEHGIWTRGFGGAIEAVINAATLLINGGVLVWTWRRRVGLLAGADDLPEAVLD